MHADGLGSCVEGRGADFRVFVKRRKTSTNQFQDFGIAVFEILKTYRIYLKYYNNFNAGKIVFIRVRK